MSWEAIGAIGEIVGAAAVVLSLVYLGRQIEHQNRESRIASMHEMGHLDEKFRAFVDGLELSDFSLR